MSFGNIINRVMESNIAAGKPMVGMGATILMWSDRKAATVIRVSASGKTIWLKEDTAIRVDRNGMSDAQSYRFEPNPNGIEYRASLRKNGRWKTTSGSGVSLGHRSAYHDFSF